jgi:hypothetical protein
MKRKGSFRRARAIVRAAISTLRRNPDLLWFPVIAAALHVSFGALCLAAASLRSHMATVPASELGVGALLHSPDASVHLSTAAGFVALLGFQIITLVTAVALTHAALESLAGRPWTVREAFSRVRERRATLAGYAILRATSGLVLGDRTDKKRGKRKRRRAGVFRRLARAGWWAATYLMVPVLAHEDRGPFDSIGRSAKLFRSTWKEGVLGRWALGWLWFPYGVVCVSPLVLGAGLGVQDETVWFVLVLMTASAFGLGGVLIRTLDTIYRAALYVFAAEGVVPAAFDVPDLHTVWHTAAPATDDLGNVVDVVASAPQQSDDAQAGDSDPED